MTQVNEYPFTQCACINQTDKFTAVTPLSGYRLFVPEDEPGIIYLEPDVAVPALGQALLKALDTSRCIDPDAELSFFSADRMAAAGKRWEEDFLQRYRYKSKREAHKTMRFCWVERSEGKITIRPHKRDRKPGLWLDLPPGKTVVIPATDDPAILGAAGKLALSYCE
jgi:hypothetical protein